MEKSLRELRLGDSFIVPSNTTAGGDCVPLQMITRHELKPPSESDYAYCKNLLTGEVETFILDIKVIRIIFSIYHS